MIPFPGESIGLGDAVGPGGWGSATNFWGSIAHRGQAPSTTGPGHAVISAGEDWWGWAYSFDRPYLEAADDGLLLGVAWVLEVLDGTGELAISDFHDDGWDYALSSPLTNSLGTLSISGAGTYVIPTSSFTNVMIRQAGFEGGPMQVNVKCTSGSVDVAQVKLRVWPATGPRGYWSTETATEAPQDVYASYWEQPLAIPVPPGGAASWSSQADARGALAASTMGTSQLIFSRSHFGGAAMQAVKQFLAPQTVFANVSATVVYFKLATPTYQGPTGVDWIRPPEEVQEDWPSLFQPQGTPDLSWAQPYLSVQQSAQTFGGGAYWYEYGNWHISIEEVAGFMAVGSAGGGVAGSGSPLATLPERDHPDPAADYVTDIAMPPPEAGVLFKVMAWPTGALEEVSMAFNTAGGTTVGGGSSGVQFFRGKFLPEGVGINDKHLALRAVWTPPEYYYWDADAFPLPDPVDPVGGYFLDPNANLDGLPDGVDVNFA